MPDQEAYDLHNSPSPLAQEFACSYIGLPEVEIRSLVEIRDKLASAYPSQKQVYVSIILDQVCHQYKYMTSTAS
jgi:hypothetical protein